MKVCQSLAGLGHPVRLWLPGTDPKATWGDLASHYGLRTPFEISWIPSRRALRHYDFCIQALRAGRAWGAELFYAWPYPAAGLAAQMAQPTLLEVHDRPGGVLGPGWVRLFLRGKGARRVLITTDALRRWLEGRYGLPLKDPFALVAPNGVDREAYEGLPSPSEARARLDLPQAFTAVYTGHLYEGRGADLILSLARENPAMQFVLAGGEPGAVREWQAKATSAALVNVRILGFLPNEDLPGVQAAGDVLLLPHARRVLDSGGGDIAAWTSPMKVFEYLACGRAIVASDLPVLREILNEGNAWLVPPEDAEAWSHALRSLAEDPRRRESLAARARSDSGRYTWAERARRALTGLGAADAP
jgi:glycosyltransferase involved in cell wall biosynthesis